MNAYITAVTVDKVALIVGPPVANIANAIKETSEDYDVPVMGFALDPNCQLKEDGTPYKNMFCFQPSATTQGEIMAAFAVKNGLKTFGVLYNQENSYSLSLLAPFTDKPVSYTHLFAYPHRPARGHRRPFPGQRGAAGADPHPG